LAFCLSPRLRALCQTKASYRQRGFDDHKEGLITYRNISQSRQKLVFNNADYAFLLLFLRFFVSPRLNLRKKRPQGKRLLCVFYACVLRRCFDIPFLPRALSRLNPPYFLYQ
jgi:hypothetical protein